MGILVKGPWPDTPHRNISKQQVSQQFGVVSRTIERWMNETPPVPHDHDSDGHPRFRKREVADWLEARSEERLDGAA